MVEYIKCFDEFKHISFFIENEKMLKTYINARYKVTNTMQKFSESEPVYNKKIFPRQNKILWGKNNYKFPCSQTIFLLRWVETIIKC